jgi:thiosulfate/3-mercaptopyruvate sulfurtransferase
MYTHLISVDQLKALQHGNTPFKVFDCSFDLKDTEQGKRWFDEAHVTGAVYVDLDHDLSASAPENAVNGGRHPLPRRELFAQTLRSLGFHNAMQAVVYDRAGGVMAARLWWMLKWAGHDAAAILDGGFQAWTKSGGAVQGGPAPAGTAGDFTLKPELRHWLDTQHVARHLNQAGQTLVDARSAERFRGDVEPLDPVAGHIPGALNRPGTENLDASGRFKPAAQLKAEFGALLAGRDPSSVVHQCGSGVYATFNLFAMELGGYAPTPIYAGSWSEWCRTPGLPVATGN